ncbi:hypothetical protein RvY_02633 [Ramazzottius varieornatus]|uniref:HMG box domain-containing protein n=1 Tax=Ramazzottius varieornatus TaxID=947166 RepID=A0A1D1UVJ1_RAMVA|nr:hypothetical protein RvY_02633 [Ramazzottius varieornatus]
MDLDKISRSGRKVRIPSYLLDTEVIDTSGRRAILEQSGPPIPTRVKIPYTGKRRGRPPRANQPFDGSGHPTGEDYVSNHDLEHDETSSEHPEESSSHADGEKSAPSMPAPPEKLRWHLTTPDKARRLLNPKPPKVPGESGKRLVRGPYKKTLMRQQMMMEGGMMGDPVTLDGQPALKKLKKTPLKHSEGDVEIPDGLLEAMRKKRQCTPYIAFCRMARPAVMQDNPDGDFSQFSKELGNRWMNLSSEEKEYWRKVACRITQLITVERETGYMPERRKARDKVVRDLEARSGDVPSNTSFDMVSNVSLVGEQMFNATTCLNMWTFQPENPDPMGCLDALLDSALVLVSSTLGLMAQVPVLSDYVDTDVFEDLSENNSCIIPHIQK